MLAIVGLGLLSACAPQPTPAEKPGEKPPERLTLAAVSFRDLPGWGQDDPAAALPALRRSCDRLSSQPEDRPVGPDGLAGRIADWKRACAQILAPGLSGERLRSALEAAFRPYAVGNNGERTGLFTGYYEPELRGSPRPDGRFRTPLLKRPDDLILVELGDFRADWRGQRTAGRVDGGRLRPYADRAAIESGALRGKGLELVWVDDPVDAFFLHVQGSGRVVMPDGRVMRVGYAAQNGHPYVAIGKVLADRGAIPREDVTMQSIRAWLARNPGELQTILNQNPSYVFFQELRGEGPLGSQGVALTPGRSLAVDPKFMPLGAPVWLDLSEPREPGGVIRRLVVAQDTGGAIRGPVRGDLFWGPGAEAADRAGTMKAPGRYFLLLPASVQPPAS